MWFLSFVIGFALLPAISLLLGGLTKPPWEYDYGTFSFGFTSYTGGANAYDTFGNTGGEWTLVSFSIPLDYAPINYTLDSKQEFVTFSSRLRLYNWNSGPGQLLAMRIYRDGEEDVSQIVNEHAWLPPGYLTETEGVAHQCEVYSDWGAAANQGFTGAAHSNSWNFSAGEWWKVKWMKAYRGTDAWPEMGLSMSFRYINGSHSTRSVAL